MLVEFPEDVERVPNGATDAIHVIKTIQTNETVGGGKEVKLASRVRIPEQVHIATRERL